MKKSVRTLLIMLAVLVVLGGAAACLLLFPVGSGEDDASSAASQAERETVVEIDAGDLASIQVENSQGSFAIVPADGASGEESGSDSAAYTIKGLEAYELDASSLKTAAEDLLSIQALRNLGEQDDLEKYGLSGERAAQATIQQKSGGQTVLVLGDTSSSGTVGQYLLKDGQVYIVPALSDVLKGGKLDCVSKAVYSIADWTIGGGEESGEGESSASSEETLPDTLFNLELSGKAFEKPITAEYVARSRLNGYMLTSPVRAESGTDAFESIVTALKSITANRVAAVGVDEAALAEYGLAEPDAQAAFKLNNESLTVKVSAKDSDGNRYLQLAGRDVVYQIENARVRPWAEAQLMDLRKSTICLANVADVEQLSLTREGDMVYDFTVDLSADDPTVQDPSGREIAYGEYEELFQQLTSLAVFSVEEAACSGTPSLRVEYHYKSGESDVVEFYPIEGQDRCACTLNGEYNGQVRGSEMAPLLEKIEDVYGGAA